MKILHTVEFYSPSVGGAQEVVKQLSEHLVLLGHQVTVATTKLSSRKEMVINGVKIKEFAIEGNSVRGMKGELDRYKSFLKKSKFDVIMNYAAQQWASDLFFEVIDQVKAKKIFVPCGFSGLYDPAYKNYFHQLPKVLKKYDSTVYLSRDYRDINFAKKNKLKNIKIIPNGADEREFDVLSPLSRQAIYEKYNIPINNQIVIQVANHTGQKGHSEAIEVFTKSILKNTTLVLVGDINHYGGCYNSCLRSARNYNLISRFITRRGNSIKVLHITRRETIRLIPAADLFIFLSNIECSPLVLFESAASGIPFLASDCGNSREISKWLGNGKIVKSFKDKFGYTKIDRLDATKKLESLLANKKKLKELGTLGYKNWRQKYTWERIAKMYESLYV